jgi:hypothetical protein
VPLLRRALKVLTDREVTPQLGLLKSTLLQLDSTFSERTYGANSFRDFAEKLAAAGFVTLREAGRNILVELKEDGHARPAQEERAPQERAPQQAAAQQDRPADARPGQPSLGTPRPAEAVAEVRRLFQAALQPPRWPMYVRQVKQYLRGVDPSFDERTYGFQSLNDLLRACQKEGLFRMERDRQGVVRFFQGNVMKGAEPMSTLDADIAAAQRLAEQAEAEMAAAERLMAEVVEGDVVRETEAPSVVDGEEATAPAEEAAPIAGEEPAGKPARKRREPKEPKAAGKSPKVAKAAKPAREKKSVTKPRSGARKKTAVAADA